MCDGHIQLHLGRCVWWPYTVHCALILPSILTEQDSAKRLFISVWSHHSTARYVLHQEYSAHSQLLERACHACHVVQGLQYDSLFLAVILMCHTASVEQLYYVFISRNEMIGCMSFLVADLLGPDKVGSVYQSYCILCVYAWGGEGSWCKRDLVRHRVEYFRSYPL